MFDSDGNGFINAAELRQVREVMRGFRGRRGEELEDFAEMGKSISLRS